MASSQQQRIRGKYFNKKLKAKKVIELYQAGERNFQGAILRGQSFKGQDLSGADFSEADIRGANFARATLLSAKFKYAKCGTQKPWAAFLIIISWLLAGILGLGSLSTAYLILLVFENSLQYKVTGYLSILLLSISWTLSLLQGIGNLKGARALLVGLVLATIGLLIIVVSQNLIVPIALTMGALAALAIPLSLALAKTVDGELTIFSVKIVTVVTILVGVAARGQIELLIAGVSAIAGLYLNLSDKKTDNVDNWARSFAFAFASIRGTSFLGADLSNADFTGARLKSTDLRKATLTGVHWYETKMLDRIRPGDTYLRDTQVRQWLIGKGTDKNFDGKDLRGVNLQGANLTNASFIGADLGEADLSETTLTGACIQEWNINNQTKFDDVICDYIFLKKDNKERIPHDPNRFFKPGEFSKYIEKALNTVDLIFTDGIDWKAFFNSLQKLQDEYGYENLGVQAIEKKSNNAFVVRIEVPPDANKAEIESHTKQLYKSNLKALEDKYRSELNAKDREIEIYKQKSADILELAKLAASRPITVEAKAVAENQSKNVEVEMNINAPSKGVVGKMTGDMNIYTSEQKQSITEVATEIVKLLDYFEQNDPSITEAQQIVKTSTENQPEILDAEIIQEAIQSSPTLKQRLGAAGTAAYIETVKMLLPPFGVAYEAYKAFRNP